MKKTILITDDSQSFQGLLRAALRMAGYNVLKGIGGEDGVDGMALTSEADHKNLPVILLTSESQAEKKKKLKRLKPPAGSQCLLYWIHC